MLKEQTIILESAARHWRRNRGNIFKRIAAHLDAGDPLFATLAVSLLVLMAVLAWQRGEFDPVADLLDGDPSKSQVRKIDRDLKIVDGQVRQARSD